MNSQSVKPQRYYYTNYEYGLSIRKVFTSMLLSDVNSRL